MDSSMKIVSFEEAVIEDFTEKVYLLRIMEYWAENHCEQMKLNIKHLALELEPYLPATRDEFEFSKKDIYRKWIKSFLIRKFENKPEIMKIIIEKDKDRVLRMTADEKEIRKRFSDTVSDVLRKIRKYAYEDKTHLKRCSMCVLDISVLCLQCVNCSRCFHYKCLLSTDFNCLHCGVKLID
jgi:hypothetical protein